jgi:multidrug efflux pump subunit AcrB
LNATCWPKTASPPCVCAACGRYEVSISVSEDALRQYGLTFSEVANAVRAASVDLSGGEIRTQAGDILLRTNARRETGAEFENIILRSSETGARVRLGDVAEINDGLRKTR